MLCNDEMRCRPTSGKVRPSMAFVPWFRAALPGILILIAIGMFWTAGYLAVWFASRSASKGRS